LLRRHGSALILLICLVRIAQCAPSDTADTAWRDPSTAPELRAAKLVAALTLSEKIDQLSSQQPAIDRLGIGSFDFWNEALHGVAAQRGFSDGYATVFPQCIGLSASWDPQLISSVAQAISVEARAKNKGKGSVFFCPNVNIFRDPRWGRGQETWGEDPYLTARMAVAFIRGFQGDDPTYLRNAAVVKHFAVHSGPEDLRYVFNSYATDRDLYDTYLPAFNAAVTEGHVAGVMSAYNRFRGVPCTCNDMLLTGVLRNQWHFGGFVISDASASTNICGTHHFVAGPDEAAALTLSAGCDLPIGPGDYAAALAKSFISEEMIDRALIRAFTIRFRLGEFDPPQRDPYSQIAPIENDSPAHRALARQAAQESIVLLKNDGTLLPLSKSLHTIAVIGPNADVAHLGNYSGRPSEALTPLQAITAALPKANVLFSRGCGITSDMQYLKPMPGSFLAPAPENAHEHGLKAEYFDNDHFAGPAALVRTDASIDFDWADHPPCPQIKSPHYSVRWTGTIASPLAAAYPLTIQSTGSARVLIDGKRIIDDFDPHPRELSESVLHLDANQPRQIEIDYVASADAGQFGLKAWGQRWADATVEQAVEFAQQADAVILCVGTNPDNEGEMLDRTTLALPADQEALTEKLLALGKPTVMVLMNGGAMTFPFAKEHAQAILESWYPGEEGGNALADILFGDANPSARLPVTFYNADADLPPFEDYNIERRTYRYFPGPVEYPFGFGLSYSTFKLDHPLITSPDSPTAHELDLSVNVTNTSNREGDDVIQALLSRRNKSAYDPIKQLAGFTRVHLLPGQTQPVSLHINLDQLSPYDVSIGRPTPRSQYNIVLSSGDGSETPVP
jgi:beta-glucosidase